MRSNSGRDESRNNLHDPTMDRDSRQGERAAGERERKAPADHRQGRKH